MGRVNSIARKKIRRQTALNGKAEIISRYSTKLSEVKGTDLEKHFQEKIALHTKEAEVLKGRI